MQKYKNVINECLIKAEQNVLVGDVVQLPELHLLIGVTNFYYKKLEKVWPQLPVWGHRKLTVYGRQGGGLNGANCERFMKKIDVLQKLASVNAVPILNTLQLFKRVQNGCFGWDLCPDYKGRIHYFIISVKKL